MARWRRVWVEFVDPRQAAATGKSELRKRGA
jgi:hypothetical protein